MRSRCDSTFASLHISRCVTSDFDISSVKSATGTSLRTREVRGHAERRAPTFPSLGRAATMIRFPGWKPERERSRSRKPGRDAGDVGAGLVERGDPLEALLQQLLDVAELARDALLREVEDDLLGLVDEHRSSRRGAPSRAARSRRRPRISPRSVAISRTIRA